MLFLIFLLLTTHGNLVHLKDITLRKFDNAVILNGPPLREVPSNLDVTDIGDIVARSFWAGKLKEQSHVKLGPSSSDANLLIINFGLDKSSLSHIKLEGTKANLDNQFFPADHVSLLTSIATGKNPNEHGVIGEKWNVNDVVHQAYTEGEKATFSSKLTFAQMIQRQDSRSQVHTYARNLKLGASLTQDLSRVQSLQLSRTALHHKLQEESFWTSQQSNLAQLDLENPDVEAFLTECEQARRVADTMSSGKHPQFYNFAFSAAQNINTPPALAILNRALQYLKSSFDSQHPSGSSQIVFLRQPEVENPETKLGKTLDYVHPKEFGGCDHMQCLRTVQFSALLGDTAAPTTAATPASPKNSMDGAGIGGRVMQISSWLIVAGVLIVISFSYVFSNMNYQTDAILFTTWQRGTKPKMGQRF